MYNVTSPFLYLSPIIYKTSIGDFFIKVYLLSKHSK